MQNSLDTLLPRERLKTIREMGLIVFDVDDTLLARRNKTRVSDQGYTESDAAKMLPHLLNSGYRICIITGHGWGQLRRRLIEPLFADIRDRFPAEADKILTRVFIYANRGATRVGIENSWKVDPFYGREYSFAEPEKALLREVFANISDSFYEDYINRSEWYIQAFPEFDFQELPAVVIDRENVVLSLRPIPSEAHAAPGLTGSPRRTYVDKASEGLHAAGLSKKYAVEPAGKSTLEITRKGLSKESAFRDALMRTAKEYDVSAEKAEMNSLFIGDEFWKGGNDRGIAENFPNCLCISVCNAEQDDLPANVALLEDFIQMEKIQAAFALATHILKSSH